MFSDLVIKRLTIMPTLVVLGFLLSACETSYSLQETERYLRMSTLIDDYHIERGNQWAIKSNADIYVAKNIGEPNRLVKERISNSLQKAFGRYFNSATIGPAEEDLRGALRTARSFNSQYVVYPRLQIWNAQSKQWQGYRYEQVISKRVIKKSIRPGSKRSRHWQMGTTMEMQDDSEIKRLRLALDLYDANNEQKIDSIHVTSRAGLISRDGDHPLERFNEPLLLLAKQLAGG